MRSPEARRNTPSNLSHCWVTSSGGMKLLTPARAISAAESDTAADVALRLIQGTSTSLGNRIANQSHQTFQCNGCSMDAVFRRTAAHLGEACSRHSRGGTTFGLASSSEPARVAFRLITWPTRPEAHNASITALSSRPGNSARPEKFQV